MKTDDIKKLYEASKKELQRKEAEHYALGQLIKVLDEANEKYSNLLKNIEEVKKYIKECASKSSYLSKSFQKDQEKYIAIKNSGLIQVDLEEEIDIDWWTSPNSSSYFASSVRQSNTNWEKEVLLLKKRHLFLQQLCNSQGIDCKIIEEKKSSPGFGSNSIVFYSTLQVPISILEKNQQLDAGQVRAYLKDATI